MEPAVPKRRSSTKGVMDLGDSQFLFDTCECFGFFEKFC